MTEIAELMQELKMPVELYPEYTNDLIEVVNRAIINPQGASKILPFLELFYLWSILMENGANLESLFKALNRPLETAPIVFAKDASRQFCLFTGLKTALFECLHSL
jgi:hypothetical protein